MKKNQKTIPVVMIFAGVVMVCIAVYLLTKKTVAVPDEDTEEPEPKPKKNKFGAAMQNEATDVNIESNE